MFKKILKILGYIFGLILFVLIVLTGITQSKVFKERLRVMIISTAEENINGSLRLGTIRGNFITGFSIDSVAIYTDGELFLSTGIISLNHDPFSIWYKTITLRSMSIEKPKINLIRSNDSLWNIKKIFKPSETEGEGKFDWTIKIEDIKIRNGSFKIYDSLSSNVHVPTDTIKYLDYHNFDAYNFNMRLAAIIKNNNYKLKINELSGKILSPEFFLNQLSGEFNINEKGGTIKDLVIVTGKTRLQIDAELNDINIFRKISLIEFEHKPIKLKLLANYIDFDELKTFLRPLYFLNGNAYIDLDLEGEFGNIIINNLNLNTYDNIIKLTGSIKNLHTPKELFLDVKIADSKIIPQDVNKLLPYFRIPEFKQIKEGELTVHYVGNPLNFKGQVNLKTNAGNIDADVQLNLKNSPMSYKGKFRTYQLNLSKILNDDNLTSSINSVGEIEGEGTNIDNLNSRLNIIIDSTRFAELYFKKSDFAFQAKNEIVEAVILANASGMKSYITSKIDLKNRELPKYDIEASFNQIDLSKIFKNDNYLSNLSFRCNISAQGKNINSLSTNTDISILPSSYGEYNFGDEEIYITLTQNKLEPKSLSIVSPVADISFNGLFELDQIPNIFSSLIENFNDAINSRLGIQKEKEYKIYNSSINPFNFTYNVEIKDLIPISNIVNKQQFNFFGGAYGKIFGDSEYTSSSGKFDIMDFYIGSLGQGVLVSNTLINYNIDSVSSYKLFDNINFNLDAVSDEIVIDKNEFTNVNFKINYNNLKGDIAFNSKIDRLNSIIFAGNVEVQSNAFDLNINNLKISFEEYDWSNIKDIYVSLDQNGINISDFTIKHNEKETFTLSGSLQNDGKLNLKSSLDNYQLRGLKYFFKNANLNEGANKLEGELNTEISLTGDSENPILSASLLANNIFFRDTEFGNMRAFLIYKDKKTDLNIEIKSKPEQNASPDFKIQGYFPIDLRFSNIETRFPEDDVNISILSDGFQLSLLNPLIPVIENLNGIMKCNLEIVGTPSDPRYKGELEFDNTRFLIKTNNIYYNFSGILKPEEDKIKFLNFNFFNDKNDYRDGKLTIDGYFSLREFAIDSFDVYLQGQLLLLKDAPHKSMSNIHGRLIGAIGKNGLHYQGKFTKSNLTGSIQIKEANLVFPPSQGTTYADAGNLIRYITIDDTTKISTTRNLKDQFYYPSIKQVDTLIKEKRSESKIWQGLTYDIDLETRGTSNVRMIFNSTTNEELYAELDGKINLQRYGGRNYTIGEISISDRSYYNFFKRFDASGTLKFFGEPENPEFDIKATYTGYRQPPAIGTDTLAQEQKVVITIHITGTRMEPSLQMSITIDDKNYAEVIQGGDLQSDAISFLFTNKFRDDLTTREKSDIVSSLGSSAGKAILAGATSTMLSGILTDFLRKEFSFIRSAEITYAGGNVQQSADLRLSGQIFNAYWRFGGKIFDDINNANISFSLNFGDLFDTQTFRNLFLELERKVDGGEIAIDRKFTNSARIYYRWSF